MFKKKEKIKVEDEPEKLEPENIEIDEEEIDEEPKKVPNRIVLKQAVTMELPAKNSWIKLEAPDKNGVKIRAYQGKALKMKEKLMEQQEIITFIPCEQGEPKDIPCIVNLNGYKLNIPKNTYVSLPIQIHEIIRKSHDQVENAYNQMNSMFGIDRDSRSVEALE